MLGATLTTAATWQATSASALTRSRSIWSMIAISPGRRRLVRSLVRLSRRAGPATPGSSGCRLLRSVVNLIRVILPERAPRTRQRSAVYGRLPAWFAARCDVCLCSYCGRHLRRRLGCRLVGRQLRCRLLGVDRHGEQLVGVGTA